MAAEIDRPDLITDGALRVPEELATGFTHAEKRLDQLIESVVRFEQVSQEQTITIQKLIKRVDQLEKEQKNLVDINKKLTVEVNKNKKALENQAGAVEALDNRLGGTITRFKQLGKELWALVKHPVVLILAVLVGLFAALASSVKTFYTATGEGEDILEKQMSVWGQFFNVLKAGWGNLGKQVSKVGDQSEAFIVWLATAVTKLTTTIFPALAKRMEAGLENFKKQLKEAQDLTEKMDKTSEKVIANIIKQAETRSRVNELVLKSQNEIAYSDEQRLAFLEQAVALQEQQMRIDKQIAKEQRDALILQTGLNHALTEEKTKSLTQDQMNAIFTEEENQKIAESIAKVIDMEGNYYQEVKKNAHKIISLKEEIYQKNLKKAEEQVKANARALKLEMDEEIEQVRYKAEQRQITERQAEERIFKIRQDYASKFAEQQIDGARQILDSMNLKPEDRARLEAELQKLGEDLREAFWASFKEDSNDIEEILVGIKKQYDAFAGSITSIFQSITDRRLQQLDKEEKALDEMLDKQLKAAGDNEDAKDKLERKAEKRREDIEKRRITLLRRAAIFERAIAVGQAIVNTAVAVTSLLETPPLAIAAAIAGAAQVAAIIAEPLPAYQEGGITGNEKLSRVSEQGTEAFITPDGKLGFTPDEESFMKFQPGTQIFDHGTTMAALAAASMYPDSVVAGNRDYELISTMIKEFKSLKKIIKNKKEFHMNWSARGAEAAIRNGESYIKMLDEFYA